MNIGERIRFLRKERGLTIQQLAFELKIPSNTIGNYERGDRNPELRFLIEISNFFEVSLDYLIKGDLNYAYALDFFEDYEQLRNNLPLELQNEIELLMERIIFFFTKDAYGKISTDSTEIKLINSLFSGLEKAKIAPIRNPENLTEQIIEANEEIDMIKNQLLKLYNGQEREK